MPLPRDALDPYAPSFAVLSLVAPAALLLLKRRIDSRNADFNSMALPSGGMRPPNVKILHRRSLTPPHARPTTPCFTHHRRPPRSQSSLRRGHDNRQTDVHRRSLTPPHDTPDRQHPTPTAVHTVQHIPEPARYFNTVRPTELHHELHSSTAVDPQLYSIIAALGRVSPAKRVITRMHKQIRNPVRVLLQPHIAWRGWRGMRLSASLLSEDIIRQFLGALRPVEALSIHLPQQAVNLQVLANAPIVAIGIQKRLGQLEETSVEEPQDSG